MSSVGPKSDTLGLMRRAFSWVVGAVACAACAPAPAPKSEVEVLPPPSASASVQNAAPGKVDRKPGVGRLPPTVIQQIVRSHFSEMRRCYEDALRTSPKLEGKVLVRFIIDRDGHTSSAEDGGSTIADPNVIACVVSEFKALVYPVPEGGIITVVYPILFSLTQ